MPIRRPGSVSDQRLQNIEDTCVQLVKGQGTILKRLSQLEQGQGKLEQGQGEILKRLDNLESMLQEVLTLFSVEKVK